MAVAIVIPADGPSLGTAPSGICICIAFSSKIWFFLTTERTYESAICADSRITSPIFPVRISSGLPPRTFTSISRVSPPAAVHASPRTMPTSFFLDAFSLMNLTFPRYSLRFLSVMTICFSIFTPPTV